MKLRHWAAAAGLVLATSLGATGASAAKCVLAGGEGTGVTADIAKQLATIALNNSIAAAGLKAKGKVTTTCTYQLVVTNCTARQRACK